MQLYKNIRYVFFKLSWFDRISNVISHLALIHVTARKEDSPGILDFREGLGSQKSSMDDSTLTPESFNQSNLNKKIIQFEQLTILP